MKRILLALLLITASFRYTYAAPSFSEPILQKASEQVELRIDKQAAKTILDENSKKIVEEKKTELMKILLSIDSAFQKKDKAKFREQARLFRAGYQETMRFVQNPRVSDVSPNSHKNIPPIETVKSTDITYYADSFE